MYHNFGDHRNEGLEFMLYKENRDTLDEECMDGRYYTSVTVTPKTQQMGRLLFTTSGDEGHHFFCETADCGITLVQSTVAYEFWGNVE